MQSIRTVLALAGVAATMSAQAVIEFADVSGPSGFQPAMNADVHAGGIAVADFDRNGFPDIFVTGYSEPNRLFYNDGTGQFFEIPAHNAQLQGALCNVAAAADYDNDGWPDLYVACRNGPNHLFRNTGTGFADVTTAELDHDPPGLTPAWVDGVAWGDLDRNGLPDLFVGTYPTTATADPSDPFNRDRILLQMAGPAWIDAAQQLDFSRLIQPTLAAVQADIDRDGRTDIYVVNDKNLGNVLWRNTGPGCGSVCFEDVSLASGADRPVFGMGIAIGDIDRDGRPDLFFSSIGEQVLLRSTSSDPLAFEEVQNAAGVSHPGVGWATIFADFDHDGHEDAYLAVMPTPDGTIDGTDQIYRNLGSGSFANVTGQSGLDIDLVTIAGALIDFDRDGRLDLVLGHGTNGYRLYRNQTTAGNWIGFELEGGSAGVSRDALGARVEIQTADGTQWREVRSGESRGASHDPIVHFGIGDATAAEVTIHWPDGLAESLGPVPAGRYHHRAHPNFDPLFSDSLESAP
ncbi:CRTAC1 family protein [Wenzhouxiangella sp. XN79A]|uniref:CRTAC1 family protein n=1 Tax=Wenzhouxiangella sp. XN79A TaxID=2724193 RepID=UPI00144AA6C4|nr:CRTAC1 family protein [Wenzhouxiangella sp. XN79A]NKI34216.1 CRTAC1 family protein [Wenzhouxiangella sp. XN79A]